LPIESAESASAACIGRLNVIEVTQLAFATFGGVILEGYVKRQVFLVRLLIGSTALGGVSAFAQQAAAQAQAAATAAGGLGGGVVIV
jgi:hypothetical protein